MDKSIRTAIGAAQQTANKTNLPYVFVPNSVMNEQLNIFPDMRPDSTYRPYTRYVTIGVGGLTSRFLADNRMELVPIPHEPRHTGLYDQTPWVIRDLDNDLTVAERLRYRLRKIIPIGTAYKVAYYGRLIDYSKSSVTLEYRTVKDGIISADPWEPTSNDQYPPRPVINPGQTYVTGDDYIAATAKTRFEFTKQDMAELVNVGNILYNNPMAMTISEMALCSGADATVDGQFNGSVFQYTDAIGVQITDFVSTLISPLFQSDGAAINLDIGSTEPLLALRQLTTTP